MNNYWVNNTNPIADTPAATASGSSSYLPYVGAGLVGMKYLSNPNEAINSDLSNPLSGAMTGAGLGSTIGALAGTGSFAGPIGTAVGAGIGALAGIAGKAAGIGKTKYKGYTPISGVYNQGGQLTRLGNENQYNAYNNAMNYLNRVNSTSNPNWSLIGDSELGKDTWKTKGVFKNKYSSAPAYKANLNTGYNVMDNFTNSVGYAGNALDDGWDTWKNRENSIYKGTWNILNNANKYDIDNSLSGYSASNLASEMNDIQYNNAKNKLLNQLNNGYLDQRAYGKALAALNEQRVNNFNSLSRLGKNQINLWKDDIGQAYNRFMETPTDDDWIKYYGGVNFDDSAAKQAVDSILENQVSDDYLRYLMEQGDTYQPYQYVATGIANSDMDDGLSRWYNNGRRRTLPLVYEGE